MTTMKRFIHFFILLFFNVVLSAQDKSFQIDPAKPKAGDQVTINYDPANTPLSDANTVSMVAHFYCNGSKELMGIKATRSYDLQRGEKYWTCKITIDPPVDFIGIKFENNDITDNNAGQGYCIRLYDADGNETLNSRLGYASALANWGHLFMSRDYPKAYEIMKSIFTAYTELKIHYMADYLTSITKAFRNDQAPMILKELAEFETSKSLSDDDYLVIARQYKSINMPDQSARVTKTAISKFPKGKNAFYEARTTYESEKDINKKMAIAKKMQEEFPVFDSYAIPPVGAVFADLVKEGKYDLINGWWNMMSKSYNLAPASYWWYADKLISANKELDVALDICEKGEEAFHKAAVTPAVKKMHFITEKRAIELDKRDHATLLVTYGKVLAMVGRKEEAVKKYEKAFSLQSVAGIQEKDVTAGLKLLIEEKKYVTAQPIIEEVVKAGIKIAGIKESLKEAYVKNKGNDIGYEEYYSKLEKVGQESYLAKQKKMMINQPAPAFTLTDLAGNKVSLSNYKGKVVVVDFWATWCGPCKASFPAMQKAVNKFKENKDVAFLFVNTWQTEVDKKKNAEDFMKETKYTFHVLLDNDNKVVTDFKVSGIPTKFIIDKSGNIRFNVVGFSGSEDIAVEELSSMIALAGQ